MANKKDLTQLRYVYAASPLHLYYETLEDGTNLLRHIRINQRTFDVPADGVTIDTVPENSIGSKQIENGAIKLEDLNDEVKNKLLEDVTDDDLENIFFPPMVTSITAETKGSNVVLTAAGENVSEDEDVTWNLSFDGEKIGIDSEGTVLTLDDELSEKFRSSGNVSVSLTCSDYKSDTYAIK